jgi:hypothetical protein
VTTDLGTTTETWIDKSDWGDGPWQHEPDRAEWRDRGFVCLALRNDRSGNWCGYLGVPPGHPWHGKDYGELDVRVHGGLTYGEKCMEDPRPDRERVCHVPLEGESDDVWWLGFDCHHACDYAPLFEKRMNEVLPPDLLESMAMGPLGKSYKSLTYVAEELRNMVLQAFAAQRHRKPKRGEIRTLEEEWR